MKKPIPLKPGQQIYYHVGLGKAASTYLQYDVFPALRGVRYIPRNRFKQHHRIIPGLDDKKILLSRENSQRLEAETGKFAAFYPEAIPIIVLRRHDGWVASQYRRYVKNGGVESFEEFLDIDQDNGVWRQSELVLLDKLKILERHFNRPPVVMIYDSLREDPLKIVDEFSALLGADYDAADVVRSPRHSSWSDHRLLYLRKYNKYLFSKDAGVSAGPLRRWLHFRARLLTSYTVMGVATFAPQNKDVELVPAKSLKRIRAFYEQDWQRCLAYADQHNPATVKQVRDGAVAV